MSPISEKIASSLDSWKEGDVKKREVYRKDKDVSSLVVFSLDLCCWELSLCTSNGITVETFVHSPNEVEELEMTHYNFPAISGLEHFTHLVVLRIVCQDIMEITGLENCQELRNLWICETKIDKIQGLEKCTKLETLHLYSNCIRKIENLDSLENLQTLWLSDNEIEVIENLDKLNNLRVLQLGNNKISKIETSLSCNTRLEELNLAGNCIFSFTDIFNLASLQKLSSLSLHDPNFKTNPICDLYNYQTHVVYHLPNLKFLDTLEITDESRQIIVATVLKKTMYYNMRISTITRNCNYITNLLTMEYKKNLALLEESHKAYRYALQISEKHISNESTHGKNHHINMEYEKAHLRANKEIMTTTIIMRESKRQLKQNISTLLIHANEYMRYLIEELETGGNVRFEYGREGMGWFDSISDFTRSGARLGGIGPIHINKITKFHHRYFRHCFEKKIASENINGNVPFEYLFYEEDGPGGFNHIMENSFLDIPLSAEKQPPVAFHNYLRGINQLTEHQLQVGLIKFEPRYRVILAKVYVGKNREVNDAEYANGVQYFSSQFQSVYKLMMPGKGTKRKSAAQSQRSSKQAECRKWLLFDRELAFPEYFIEFSMGSKCKHHSAIENILNLASSSSLADPLLPQRISASEYLNSTPVSTPKSGDSLPCEIPELNFSFHEQKQPIQCSYDFLKDLKPPIPQDCKRLDLTGLRIQKWIHSPDIRQLRVLILSFNELEDVTTLSLLPRLEKLDISNNRLTSILSLGKLPFLRHFDISYNFLSQTEQLSHISKTVEELDYRHNPIYWEIESRDWVALALPNLKKLNGNPVCKDEKELVDELKNRTFAQIYSGRSVYMKYVTTSLTLRTWATKDLEAPVSMESQLKLFCAKMPESFHEITYLNLDHCKLRALDDIPPTLTGLKMASFRNNFIKDVTPLAKFPRLEQLCLDRNEIESVDPLAGLPRLETLTVCNNRITTWNSNRSFKNLRQLWIDSNRLRCIKGCFGNGCLMELYAGNNKISDLYTVFLLREFPKMLILDLCGNFVTESIEYRLFTIFHLQKLKILDGLAIEQKEQIGAKEMYLGKLTNELLAEKVGHFSFHNIAELDLGNCGLKEVSCFNNTDFRNLKKLNFDNNLLTNIDPLRFLGGLRYLSLNNNRIERLLSEDVLLIKENGSKKYFFPFLEDLFLGYNQISSIHDLGLARMPVLKVLHLQGNKIQKLEGLQCLQCLLELVLDKNLIKFIEPNTLSVLSNLRNLHIKYNRLRSLANLCSIPKLRYLYLNGNRIHETAEIMKLSLPSIIEISLHGNAVARKQLYRYILLMQLKTLQIIDGKEVSEEDKEKAQAYFDESTLAHEDISSAQGSAKSNLYVGSSTSKTPVKVARIVLEMGQTNKP